MTIKTIKRRDGTVLQVDFSKIKQREAITAFQRKQIQRSHYYAQITSVDGLAKFHKWDNCRLYLNKPVNPTMSETTSCLGVVWLHNPSDKLGPRHILHSWGRVNLNCDPGETTLGFVIPILQSALEAALRNGFTPTCNAHVNIEQLVYLDSEDRQELWKLPEPQIQKYSHSQVLDPENIGFHLQNPKFILLGWGDLACLRDREMSFNDLTEQARQNAIKSNADIILVAKFQKGDKKAYPTYHFARNKQKWIRRWKGEVSEYEHHLNWNFPQYQPIHPEELRKSKCSKIIEQNLTEAIASTLN
jgi:hypothetical protein